VAAEGLPQRRGTEQAADVVGTERRSACCGHSRLPEKFYNPIGRI
jgi:hypothetical protein